MGGQSVRPKKRAKLVAQQAPNKSCDFAWKMCREKSIKDRIAIKEHAVQRAELHTNRLCELLRKYAQDDCTPGAQSLQSFIRHVGKYRVHLFVYKIASK